MSKNVSIRLALRLNYVHVEVKRPFLATINSKKIKPQGMHSIFISFIRYEMVCNSLRLCFYNNHGYFMTKH